MAMDIRGFSRLRPADHYKVIQHLYAKIAEILTHVCKKGTVDRKTIGDGFLFYFDSAFDAVEAPLHIRRLFRETAFWEMHQFTSRLSCRIGLHFGTFYKMRDAIEDRDAYFGVNAITVARLEPIVRQNEIWCTNTFREEVKRHEINPAVKFEALGKQAFAKGWSEEDVFALYIPAEESSPRALPARAEPVLEQLKVIDYSFGDKAHPNTYFALVRLKHRIDGVEHLTNYLSRSECECVVEAVYDVFGAFDILIRFKSAKIFTEKKFSSMLSDHKIIWPKDKCELTQVRFEKPRLTERIVVFPQEDSRYLKAFTYIKSTGILRDKKSVHEVVKIARSVCGIEGVVTYYRNSDVLILPIVIPAGQYYVLAKTIEAIESLVDRRHWQNVSIITYPVHGFQEFFVERPTIP
jgi:class 3 adenylate cyclase